jgi:histidyl-tRNA synthetase
MVQRVKGTQDFLDLTLFNFLIQKIEDHLALYNFSPIATPLIEPAQLFIRSLGDHTDVVSKEMFMIKTEPEQESLCLRPEATASTIRAFIENRVSQIPWQVYSYGPMFRYERPQKGRYRQFHQFNIEIIGSAAVAQDTQLIVMLDRLFHEKFSLDTYALKLNYLGTSDERTAYLRALKTFLASRKAAGICDTCKIRAEKNTLRIFDCKVPECQYIYTKAPVAVDFLDTESRQEWTELQEQLELLSVSFSYDPTLVRGLDYYSKTVFEFVSDELGAQNAFCGGGRYNHLVTLLGGKQDRPSIGAAIGIERLLLLLESKREMLAVPVKPALQVVIPFSSQQDALALLLADDLRAVNLSVEVLFEGSVKSMMRKAHKMGAAYVLLLGEQEQAAREVTIKDMVRGTEVRVPQIKAASYLQK